MHFVYILQSESTARFYIGQTDNLLRRYREHASGENASTRNRGPWFVPYYEVFATRAEAVARETKLKRWRSSRALRQLIADSLRGF